jgi:dihydroxyacetone kinase-like predicted kinase
VLVVGDAALLKVHVHTMRPGAVLDLATDLGEIVKVKVDNMQIQHDEFAGSHDRATGPAPKQPGTTLVAVALGEGFSTLFTSLGAVVVAAEQTMNPSVQQIVAAIGNASREDVIIAANDPNVVLAAQQAAALANDQHVLVLPTRNMPQGLAAALVLNPEDRGDSCFPKLEAAARRCRVIEIARTVRDATFDEFHVSQGDLLSILDGRPTARGDDYAEALAGALERLDGGPFEVATVYWGTQGHADLAETLAEAIRGATKVPETTTVFGGQPHFDYVISLE